MFKPIPLLPFSSKMGGTFFLWLDYLVFGLILALSAGIGFYHGFKGRKKQTIDSYLMADRNMHPIPVALSMFVTYMSAISFLGEYVPDMFEQNCERNH